MKHQLKLPFFILTLVYIAFITSYTISVNIKKDDYITKYTKIKEKQFNTVYNSFRKLAIVSFYSVLDKPNILKLFEKSTHIETNNDELRKKLYLAIKSDYRKLKMLGIRYVNFNLPDGKNFLRMSSKKKFGDNLQLVRNSIKYVNENQLAFEGLEEGGEIPAFRFVYPALGEQQQYIGNIEASFSADELVNEFEKSFTTRARFIFDKSAMKINSYQSIDKVYKESLENANFLSKVSENNTRFNQEKFVSIDEFQSIKKSVEENILKEKKFSVHLHTQDVSKIITFLPKYNDVTKNKIAYFVTYDSDTYLEDISHEYLITLVIMSILFLLVGYIIYRELFQKELLEEKIKEKTAEVQQLYTHEHYLKNLLQTIANVNETLITTYSIGSIIESALSKLTEHESYRLVTYAYVDRAELYIRYVKGDIYSLVNDKKIDTQINYEEHILLSAIEAVKNNKTTIDNSINFTKYGVKNGRKEDYTLESSISILLKDDAGQIIGVITLFNTNKEFDEEEVSLLENLVYDVSNAISASKQRELLKRLQDKQISNYEETILAFVDMIEQRDAYTAGHTVRVARYCRILAEAFDIEEKQVIRLEKAAILHDIGKIATPDTILLKPGRLSQLEYSLIQEHALAGYQMLSKVENYKELANIIIYHHEHFDGTGYPNKVKGDDIPFIAHILIVCDAFDAMTTNRIYKSRLTTQQATQELLKNAGTQFHPEIAQKAAVILENIEIEHTSQLPTTTLEQQRFAYFFSDSLTEAYNEDYLVLMLHSSTEYKSIYKIELHQIGRYNKKFGWDKGNEMFKNIALFLHESYPQSLLFRYRGDHFVILSTEQIHFHERDFKDFLAEFSVSYDLNEFDSSTKLEEFLEIQ